ncbi:MAG: hypothetical protein HETSPECPRED_007051 [Heterodermia speciosa]|uniref:Cytochrome P450 n=1 Tax=Heterodermia speciosa TaxID=116794 RepID=A0A8H3HY15_9LECA|nr:MAG: hypothetical protein HETSPECPRED_007051 [Heterodermia speciosa]
MYEAIIERRGAVLAVGLLVVSFLYSIALVVYRLYFSPLSKFPGPRLAAATYLFEGYYDVVKRGKYTFKIRDLHAEYGPIIRINPFELHINDPDYYDSLYNREGKWDKSQYYIDSLGNLDAGFGTVEHDLHRMRRAAINPFFSKQKVAALQPVIQRLTDKLCAKFERFRGTVVPLECAFDAFTMDVITEYSLDTNFGYLDHPGWSSDFRELERAFGEMGYMQKMFPPMIKIMRSLPDKVVVWLDPKSKLLLDFFRDCYAIADRMVRETDGKKYEEKEHPTIFYEIIHSDLPPAEKLPKRLEGEAAAVLGAGAVTTAWTLTVCMYHLVVEPEKLERLRTEIRSIMPDPYEPANLQQLEKLPYLTSVILESLRLSNGVATRLARVAPDRNIYFRDWEIPRGTPVGMTSTLIHQNPEIFSQPLEFVPERWLDPKERQRLEKYLVPFSRGSRQCAGINLAWAELYIMLASLITRLDLELYETTREDVDIYSDMLIAEPKRYADGVRFRIK